MDVRLPNGLLIKGVPEGTTQEDLADTLRNAGYNLVDLGIEQDLDAEIEDQSIFRQVADVPLQFGTGIAQGVRFITDAFGADNAVSQNIRGVEDYLNSLLSAQAKKDKEEVARIFQEAEGKGLGEELLAGLRALAVSPVDFLAQGLGTAVPTLAGGLAGAALKGGTAAARAATAARVGTGVGVVGGAGLTKSTIYDEVKRELSELDLPEEVVEERARLAQEYGGENLDQILLGAGLGGLAAGTGIEKVLASRILKNAAVNPKSIKSAAFAGFKEAAPEFIQAAQEQIAGNVALQREGFEDIPTMRGVASAAALEGSIGFLLGTGINVTLPAQQRSEYDLARADITNQVDREREAEFRQEEQRKAQEFMAALQAENERRAAGQAQEVDIDAEAANARSNASNIAPPTQEEVDALAAPMRGPRIASERRPERAATQFGIAYGQKIARTLGDYFPNSGQFSVVEGEPVPAVEGRPTTITSPEGARIDLAKPTFVVVDAEGKRYGQPLQTFEQANATAVSLNKEIINQNVRGAIRNSLETSDQAYDPETTQRLFTYGYRALSPDANTFSSIAIDEAAKTTGPEYAEALSWRQVESLPEVKDRRGRFVGYELTPQAAQNFGIPFRGNQPRIIKALTKTQQLNKQRSKEGKPESRVFSLEETKAALGKSFPAIVRFAPIRAGETAPIIPIDPKTGKQGAIKEIQSLLRSKNVESKIDSSEINALAKGFTGKSSVNDMDYGDLRLFYKKLADLPRFDRRIRLPEFTFKPYNRENFVRASKFIQQSNARGIKPTQDQIIEAARLSKEDPQIDEKISALQADLSKQGVENTPKEPLALPAPPGAAIDMQSLRDALRKNLKGFGLQDIGLTLERNLITPRGEIAAQETEAFFYPQMRQIFLAVDRIDPDGSLTPEQRLNALNEVMSHEVIHAARLLDLWKPDEWSNLERAIGKIKKPGSDRTYLDLSQELYPDLDPVSRVEEAVADMFRDYTAKRLKVAGRPQNLLERMAQFFQKLRSALAGTGFQTYEDVFNRLQAGEVGARQRGEIRTLRATERRAAQEGRVPERLQDVLRGAAAAPAAPIDELAEGMESRVPREKTVEELEAEIAALDAEYEAQVAAEREKVSEVESFARRVAENAIANQNEYSNLEESIDSNRDNIRETLKENIFGPDSTKYEEQAFAAYDAEVEKLKQRKAVTPIVQESRRKEATPIESALALARRDYANYSQSSEEEFFGKFWPTLLSSVRGTVAPTNTGIRTAAKRAIRDMEQWLADNPKFRDYYNNDMIATKQVLESAYGPLTDEEFLYYRIVNGLTSPATKLPSNVGDAVTVFNLWKNNGNLDSIKMGKSAKGNLVIEESPISISGTTSANKARTLKIIDRLVKEKGGVNEAIEFLKEGVNVEELNAFNREMGYKGKVADVNVNGNGPIQDLVEMATGQRELIPRMFIFGKKVGAYTLNMAGDSRYNTIDVWESRFIRSYFDGLFSERTGLPEVVEEDKLFQDFTKLFKEEFEKSTGQQWDNSALQAMRWFYIINAAKQAGYRGASTNETISEYTRRNLQSPRKGGVSRRRTGDEEVGGAIPPEAFESRRLEPGRASEERSIARGEGALNDTRSTQRVTTSGTYLKTGNYLKDIIGRGSKIISIGAGLDHTKKALLQGLGKGYVVDDMEPNPENRESPPEYTSANQIPKDSYDAAVSHNVLNVVEPDVREFVMDSIFQSIVEGGHAIIGTRKWTGDINNVKSFEEGLEPKSLYVIKGESRSYQKGFDGNELKDYVEDYAARKGYEVSVKKLSGIAANSVDVQLIKKPEAVEPKFMEARRAPPPRPTAPVQTGPSVDTDQIGAAEALNNGQPVNSIGVPIGETLTDTMPDGTVDITRARIAPLTRRLVSQLIQSAPDKLRSGFGLDDLAMRIENYYDGYDAKLGLVNGFIRDAYRRIGFRGRKSAMDTFERYMRARENKKQSEALSILNNASESDRQLIDAWNQISNETGRINKEVRTPDGEPMRVWDSKINDGKGGWRQIGTVSDFFPRTLRREVMEVMKNPDLDPQLWGSLLDALVASRVRGVETRKDAEKYLIKEWFSDEVKSDYFAGVEKARSEALPEIFYDYSWDAATRYLNKWARRTSQIENFGQELGIFKKEWFGENIPKVRDQETQNYLNSIRERIYEIEPFDSLSNMANWLNSLATATQLGNPISASLNLLGGTITNVQEFGIKEVAKSYFELVRDWKKIQEEGTTLGILNKDFMNILRDHTEMDADKYFSKEQRISQALAKFANNALTFGGFNGAENIVRSSAMLAARSRLNSFLKNSSSRPDSKNVKKFRTWANKENIDADLLILENGSGKETEKYMRRAVNVPQGSYNIDMTPVFIDTTAGRFLFKYQKFGTQINRFFYRHFLQKFMEDPSPANFLRMIGFLGTSIIGGSSILAIREAFGYGDPGPDDEEIKKAFENEDTARAWGLIGSRAWQNIMTAGSLGFFGNYTQFALDWQDQQRVKNPMSPPGLASIDAVVDVFNRLRDQGKITSRDLDEIAETTMSFYRANKRIALAAMDEIGADNREVERFVAQRDLREIREYGRRFSEEMDIEFKRATAPGSPIRTEMTPVNKAITDALHVGDSARAKVIMQEVLKALPPKERQRVRQSIRSSIRNRQPLQVGGNAPSQQERIQFMRWARRNLPADKIEMITRADRDYRRAAARIGMGFGG